VDTVYYIRGNGLITEPEARLSHWSRATRLYVYLELQVTRKWSSLNLKKVLPRVFRRPLGCWRSSWAETKIMMVTLSEWVNNLMFRDTSRVHVTENCRSIIPRLHMHVALKTQIFSCGNWPHA